MRNGIIAVWAVAFIAAGTAVSAKEPVAGDMAVGGHLMLGGAGVAENLEEEGGFFFDATDMELKARFAGGMGGFFNMYFSDLLVLYGGLEIVGKGGRYKGDEFTYKVYTRHLDIPLGAFLSIYGVHLGAALVPSIALAGKSKVEDDNTEVEEDFDDATWDNLQRFNLGLRFFAGYAIPVGPIAIVPGLMYQMDLLNASQGDAKDADVKWRNINLMLTCGVEYVF